MTPSRPARRPWTADEQRKLDDLLRAGKHAGEIATALQRTRLAIYARLQGLDIKRKKAARRLGRKAMTRNRSVLLGVAIGLFGALAVLTARYVAVVLPG